jgi:hypothetical protein
MDSVPLNWNLLANPLNWIVIILMVFIGGLALSLLFHRNLLPVADTGAS